MCINGACACGSGYAEEMETCVIVTTVAQTTVVPTRTSRQTTVGPASTSQQTTPLTTSEGTTRRDEKTSIAATTTEQYTSEAPNTETIESTTQSPLGILQVSIVNATTTAMPITLTLSIAPGTPLPGPVTTSVGYGDGSLHDITLTFDPITRSVSLTHSYPQEGLYAVSGNVRGEVDFEVTAQVGSYVTGLTIEVDQPTVAVGGHVRFNLTVATGTSLWYTVEFGDGFPAMTSNTVSVPDDELSYSHTYSQPGPYTIDAVARSVLTPGGVFQSSTIVVQEAISIASLTSDSPKVIGDQIMFSLTFSELGTDSCVRWDFGDGDQVLRETTPNCLSDMTGVVTQHMPIVGNALIIEHVYGTVQDYHASVLVWNLVSEVNKSLDVTVLENGDCDRSFSEILGMGDSINTPKKILRSEKVSMAANIRVTCRPPRPTVVTWVIQKLIGNVPNVNPILTKTGVLTWTIPQRYFDIGNYLVKFTVYPDSLPSLAVTKSAYFTVESSAPEVIIFGGTQRAVPVNQPIQLDASESRDPDVSLLDPSSLSYNWTCLTTDGDECFTTATSAVISLAEATLSIAPGELVSADGYIFQAEVTKDGRTTTATQKIIPIPAGAEVIGIKCHNDCWHRVLVQLNLKMEAVCETCTDTNIDYHWQLYTYNGHQSIEVKLHGLTTTGSGQRFIAFKSNVFTYGAQYQVRVTSGAAYAVWDFTTNRALIGGSCSSNIRIGYAWKTDFVFTCDNWIDPEPELVTSIARLQYSFKYRVVGSDLLPATMFSCAGPVARTNAIELPQGLKHQDYAVEIIVTITNEQASRIEYIMDMKVLPAVTSSQVLLTSERLGMFESNLDARGMFSFVTGVLDLINQEEASGDYLKEDVMERNILARQSLLAKLKRSVDLLQPGSDSLLVAQSLNQFSRDPDTLTYQAKTDLANITVSVVSASVESHRQMTWEDKHNFAKALLDSLLSLFNGTRVDAECREPEPVVGDFSPEDRLLKQRTAQQQADEDCRRMRDKVRMINGKLSNILRKVRKVAMVNSLPGEEPFSYSSGATYVQMRMIVSAELTRLCIATPSGKFTVPDITSRLKTQFTIVEVMSSEENDYSYHDSAIKINSPIQSLAFADQAGDELSISDLAEPVQIDIDDCTDPLPAPVQIDPSTLPSTIYYHRVDMPDADDVLLVNVTSSSSATFSLDYHVWYMNVSTEAEALMAGRLSDDDSQWNIFIDTSAMNMTHRGQRRGHIIIGLGPIVQDDCTVSAQNASVCKEHASTLHLNMVTKGCYYWDPPKERWSSKGCKVSTTNDKDERTHCECDHLTAFATSVFVPPNAIDFSTILNNLEHKLVESVHVLATILTMLLLYCILVVALRRLDKKDLIKWALVPLSDNSADDTYHYHVTVHTGISKRAGTNSNVFFMLGGEKLNSEIRKLEDTKGRSLGRGSVLNYLLSVREPLGSLIYLRIWHDNSGQGEKASWYLGRVVIKDLQTAEMNVFLADRWLAVDKEDGMLEVLLPSANQTDLSSFRFLFYATARRDFSDDHLWLSLISRPTRSRFTRVQRLSCCLALLFTTMIANAMWYRAEDYVESPQNVHLGPFIFTPSQVFISLASSLVSVPISVTIVLLFRKAGPKPNAFFAKTLVARSTSLPSEKYLDGAPEQRMDEQPVKKTKFLGDELDDLHGSVGSDECSQSPSFNYCDSGPVFIGTGQQGAATNTKDTSSSSSSGCRLPWWSVYIAWVLVMLTVALSATFTLLYSFKWGREKASEWLAAFFLSFFQSVVLIQPVKVLGLAMVVALVVKKPKQDEFGDGDLLVDETRALSNWKGGRLAAHRVPYVNEVVDHGRLGALRVARDNEVRMWAMIKEITTYVVYILLVSFLTYDNKDPNSFRSQEELINTFVRPSFRNISRAELFWPWAEQTLVPRLYAQSWYNKDDVHWRIAQFIDDMYYYRVGAPRLRLARVQPGGCQVPGSDFGKQVWQCFPEYGADSHDDVSYDKGWLASSNATNSTQPFALPWLYQDAMALDGVPFWGLTGVFSGGGYVAELGPKASQAAAMLEHLFDNSWLDRATRALFVEFNLFNPNTNLFSVVCLVVEFPASGAAVAYPVVQTLRLYNYVGGRAVVRLVLEIFFVAFTVYFMVREGRKMRKAKLGYFRSLWNILEVFIIVGSMSAFVLYALHFAVTRVTLDKFLENKDKFVNFQYLLSVDDTFGYVLGGLVFLSMVKLLRLLRFHKRVTQLMATLAHAAKPLAHFFIFFVLIYGAFAQLGFLLFGRQLLEYASLMASIQSLFSMMLMNFNFEAMRTANCILGPAFFFAYVIVLAFVIINILVSIINESHCLVKEGHAHIDDDYRLVDYTLTQLKLFLGTFTLPVIAFKKPPADSKSVQCGPGSRGRASNAEKFPHCGDLSSFSFDSTGN